MAFRGGLVCCARSIQSPTEAQCDTSGIRLARGWRGDSGTRAVLWVGTMDGVEDVVWWTARKNAGRCDGSCSALHWASQRAPQADAACCVFCSCPVAWPEERIAARFSSFLINEMLHDGIHRAAFLASGLMAVCVPACGGERGVAPFSYWQPMLFPR